MKLDKLNSKKANIDLKSRFEALDVEFQDVMADLAFVKNLESDTQMSTFSPLEVVEDFEQRGLQRVKEVSHDEMLNDDGGMRKLLANMLSQCRPGALSQDDVEQLSGINGREMRGGL